MKKELTTKQQAIIDRNAANNHRHPWRRKNDSLSEYTMKAMAQKREAKKL